MRYPAAAAIGAAVLIGLGPAGATRALAQQPAEAGGAQVTRQALDSLLQQLEATSQSSAYSSTLRSHSRVEAALIRKRLDEGDFQVGDRIRLVVEGEPTLTDTFTVAPGRVLILPGIGNVPLDGVLRSELTTYLTHYIGQYVRNPVVHVRSQIRLTVVGAVGRPGYYTVPTEALLEDVLMMAGGPAPNARLTETRIERGRETLWDGERLQEAIAEGRTVDALNLQAGDRIVVPERAVGGAATAETWIRIIGYAVALPLAVLGLIKIF